MLQAFFQNPYFVPVLLAVTIPPIIEWLLRRRRRRITFAAMRFLLDTERPKKIKMQDRILLILRMIIIGVVVLALSRPLLRPEDVISIDRKERKVVMLFDATYSNAQRVGNLSAFSTAKRMANDVLQGLPDGVEVTLGSMGHSLKVVQPWSTDKALLQEKIENMPISHGSGPISRGLEWAMSKVDEKRTGTGTLNCEVFIFSDLQKYTWLKGEGEGSGKSARGIMPQLMEKAQVFVAGTGGENNANLYITKFEPVDKILAVGVTTEFIVDVKTSGISESSRIKGRVTLYVNDEKRYFEAVDIPGTGKDIRIPYKVLTPGEQVIKVVIEGDDSPLDNTRHYLALVPEAMKVLVLDDQGSLLPHERSSVFWQFAVAPPSVPGRDPVSAFTAQVKDWSEAQKDNFGDYGAVVLANVKELPEGLVARLIFYVREGGCLFAFAGEGIEPFPYEKLYQQGSGPLPVSFQGKKEANNGYLKPTPPLTNAGDMKEGGLKFYRELTSVTKDSMKTMAQLSSGPALVVWKEFGQGKAITIAADPSLKWGTLPLAIDYPVFVQEMLRAAMGDPNRLVNLSIGQEFSQPVMISTQQLLLKAPDNQKYRLAPEEKKGEDLPRITFKDTDVQGMYTLDAPSGVLARNRFVVNLTPEESDMAMWRPGDFQAELAKNARMLSPNENLQKLIKSMHTLREFAGMLLFLVFLLMVVESFLAMRFGLRKG